MIGGDQILDMCMISYISIDLLHIFNSKGIFFRNQVIKEWLCNIPIWKKANDLRLSCQLGLEWEFIIEIMKYVGICHDGTSDQVTWACKKKIGEIEVADTYFNLCTQELQLNGNYWFYNFGA